MKNILMAFLLIPGLVFTQELSSNDQKEIEIYLESLVKQEAPGLAVGIVLNGKVVFEHYRGLGNLQNQVSVDERTRFNIASVAKQFTALAVLQLSKEGSLALDDDIRKYLPTFYENVEEPILIRHLITHSSGIRDFYDLLSLQQKPWWRQEGFDNKDALALLEKQEDLGFQPGSEHLYSNSNYTLLTKIIEVASGKSFIQYSKLMFSSLGMNSTNFLKNYMAVIPNHALPYADWGDGVWQQYPMITNLHGDGFLFTTLRDQLKYQVALQSKELKGWLGDSQSVVPEAEIQKYGFGLELSDRLNYPAVYHSGSTGAYHAETLRFPDQNLAIVIMSGNGTLWSGYITEKIASILLPGKKKEELIVPETLVEDIDMQYLKGEYQQQNGDIVRIEIEKEIIYWKRDNNNPLRLNRSEKNVYEFEIDPSVKVVFSIKGLSKYDSDSEESYERLPPFNPSKNYLNALIGKYENKELDIRFSIDLDDNFQPLIKLEGKPSDLLEIIQKDAFLLSDYRLQPSYDAVGQVKALLLNFSRIKNMRFTKIESSASFRKKFTSDGGYIQVSTTSEYYSEKKGGILLTKNSANGNEEWSKQFDAKSYDRASSISLTEDRGYLITGSTSSYGNGNYDIWIIKTDPKGKKVWDRTFGGKLNDYGLYSVELANGSVKVKGTQQFCEDDQFQDCRTEDWVFTFSQNDQ